MIITKKVERLYILKQYENIKVVYEVTQDIWDKDPVEWYKELSDMLWSELKKDAELIKKPEPTE